MVSEWRASHGGPRRPFLLAARRRRLERARYQWRQTRRRKNHRRRQRRHRLNLSNQRGISCNRRRSKRSSLVFLSVLPRDFLKRSEHPGAQMRTKAMAIRCVAISVLLVCTAAMRAQPRMCSDTGNRAVGSSVPGPRPTLAPRPLLAITVINTCDSGPGSLRQALTDAHDGDRIDFAPALDGQTITLTSAELVIDKNITTNGPGPNTVTISGSFSYPSFRVFHVMPGHTATIQGLTITGGSVGFGEVGG